MKLMSVQEFLVLFSSCLDSNPDVLSVNTVFWELDGWSSIVALSIVSMIYEEYGVVLRSSDLKEVKTIGQLYDVVVSKSDNLQGKQDADVVRVERKVIR